MKHVSKLPLRKQNLSFKNRPSGEEGSGEEELANGLHVPCSLDGQACGGAERCLHGPVSKGRGKGGALGPGVWGGEAVAPKPTCWIPRASPSPLAETVDGETLWCPSLRPFSCSMPGLGSLPPGQRPYPCSSGLFHAPLSN